jgi:hypothetical protein
MKKIGLVLSLVAALALPGTALAHKPEGKNKRHARGCLVHASSKAKRELCALKRQARRAAVRQCREERAEDLAAFVQKYGVKHSLRRCVRQTLQETIADFKNAAKECKAEAENDPVAFLEKYGTNHNKRNAFGKCVSSHVREGDSGRGDEAGDGNGGNEGPDGGVDD